VQPVAEHRQYHQPFLIYFNLLLPNCCETPLICVLGTLLSDDFNLCFQHLVLTNLSLCSQHLARRYLQSLLLAPCSYTTSVCVLVLCSQIPSICVFSIFFLHTFSLFSQHRVVTHVLSATTSQKLSMCVLHNLFSHVLKYGLSATSSYTLPICSKHRIAGYIVL
jgi:hypothetical protein